MLSCTTNTNLIVTFNVLNDSFYIKLLHTTFKLLKNKFSERQTLLNRKSVSLVDSCK